LEEFDPQLVLLDLHLGAQGSGIDRIPLLDASSRAVVVLTSETDPSVLAPALEAGAAAVLDKTMPFPDLISELEQIPRGGSAASRERNRRILHASRLAAEERERRLSQFRRLTPREEEVLGLLIDGVQAADIAERTYVSLSTVRSHIRSILMKMGVGSQLAAVSAAIRAGWTPRGQ
jgi:DNA-binding NarL/FixJ family response regulator